MACFGNGGGAGSRLLVASSDPAHSYLLDKLGGRDLCCGSQMPVGGTRDAGAIQHVADWICEGAPND